jgi:Fic/DOC family
MDANLSSVAYNRIVKFCSEECTRQRSGEISVSNMFDAWMWLLENQIEVWHNATSDKKVETILEIARRVEPIVNADGFRKVNVRIGGRGWVLKIIKVRDFPRVLGTLCDSPTLQDPKEFFRQFEMIHPFVDGNGRTGAIIYNMMMDPTMEHPKDPPDLADPAFFRDQP